MTRGGRDEPGAQHVPEEVPRQRLDEQLIATLVAVEEPEPHLRPVGKNPLNAPWWPPLRVATTGGNGGRAALCPGYT
ncbi:hypothetical protein ACFT5C_18350 [Streptomyces sp. NPDC057116]|uniref:hypothetical protein n=1 Tax=Streptomyces sp. NPDC057116 TaxID=3346023 RepID=UPI003635D667